MASRVKKHIEYSSRSLIGDALAVDVIQPMVPSAARPQS